ncbi:MAG: protein translocase subunit SecD [Phycisphaerae bacterium]|nr:protein translocase subunit SecD [Phycisphaerae bacterium]
MNRNLVPKFVLIFALVAIAIAALYPPSKTLKPGIDLAGGTSLIYAINTEGLTAEQEKDLAQKMITVLRRRIDPANIQNLVWRPLGNTRFEIQMPLASKETQDKRDEFQVAMDGLLAKNVNPATIMRALKLPAEPRKAELVKFAQDDPNHLAILNTLASVHDERLQLQQQRDTLAQETQALGEKMRAAGLDVSRIDANRGEWTKLNGEALKKTLTDFLGAKADPQNLESVQTYLRSTATLADAKNKLAGPGGANERYDQSRKQLDQLTITRERITYVAELGSQGVQRAEQTDKLKVQHPDRAKDIERVIATYDDYRPFQGRLDDPADLRRMLKGAGILEFRILPTRDRPELSAAEIQRYQENLVSKGPKAASDTQYVWVEIENLQEWRALTNTIVGQFGEKYYVLASNRSDEAMLHGRGGREWKLESSHPTSDEVGRRAIGFNLDLRGGDFFYTVTSKNQNRPLAIVLDDKAISAPNINSPIHDRGIIQGTFTPTQVNDMVDKLNAGSLPARLIEQPISERIIGPSLGADNRDRGIKSGLIGVILVVGFMMAYYFVGGAIADAALMMNILFTLAIMAMIRATFTLPGIAGMILTIGMSVDANVLIFERIWEEQAKGIGLATAIKNGYQRAFSAIFDSNLTTILTAAILYFVGSEDVKGFAIVLMLGIGSSMFTAIVVTRAIMDFLVSKRIIKGRLRMLHLVRVWNIDWMGLRPIFFTISAVLVFGGLALFFARGKSKYDIEFTGGTSVQVDFKSNVSVTRQTVEDRMVEIGKKLNNADLQNVSVYSVGNPKETASGGERVYDQYEITTTATNKLRTTVTPDPNSGPWTVNTASAAIRQAQAQSRGELGTLEVASSGDKSFLITANRVNPPLVQAVLNKAFPNAQISEPQVDEVVGDAIMQAFAGQLQIQENLQPTIASTEKITEQVLDTYPELADYVGGLKMNVTLARPATLKEIDQRMKDLRFRPDTQHLVWYSYQIFGADLKPVAENQAVTGFTFASTEPEAGLRELTEDEWTRFVDNEKTRIQQATERETSLSRVTQIDPFVGSEARTRSIISVVLSLAAIVAYIWVRFGTLRFGLAAIIACFHDVSTALGAVAASAFLATTFIGQAMLIGDFRINSTVIAAVLTLLGYSLNDTIVVFDRIRENRRKVQLTARVITDSINQTLSRTMITGITTFMVVAVMYIFAGSGLRGFNFVIFLGLLVGTYSSIAIAAPLLLIGLPNQQEKAKSAVKIEGMKKARAKPERAM